MDPKRPLAHQIAEALITDIRDGAIAKGDALPTERALCERFDASRPTIREALSIMATRGYALTGGSRRPRATVPDMKGVWQHAIEGLCDALGDNAGLAQIEQIRQFIEASAASFAAREARQTDLARMAEALRQCDATLGNHDAFVAADRAFHNALIACVGNQALSALLDTLLGRLIAGRDTSDQVDANDRISCDEHHKIFDAIVAGESLGAGRMMQYHLDRAFRIRLRARLEDEA